MQYFESEYFTFKNNNLFCENVEISEMVKEYGTPAYIYSKKFFTDRYKEIDIAFKDISHTIFYACK